MQQPRWAPHQSHGPLPPHSNQQSSAVYTPGGMSGLWWAWASVGLIHRVIAPPSKVMGATAWVTMSDPQSIPGPVRFAFAPPYPANVARLIPLYITQLPPRTCRCPASCSRAPA